MPPWDHRAAREFCLLCPGPRPRARWSVSASSHVATSHWLRRTFSPNGLGLLALAPGSTDVWGLLPVGACVSRTVLGRMCPGEELALYRKAFKPRRVVTDDAVVQLLLF
ncbi:hypothetical protein E2562_021253 [Oryza meyeriana var. granulata]|uniref:Uncharacterized protein n=1 Tax=Oryza meyeriana var. granulata TaxID=110450 RepID=A0A6G1DYU1_9ORYZ|nr:hypothetical protein E2562_021253 [Oryza meyeriana var. granulata]